MKKNILTIAIMAASVLNLVLTIVLVFSIVPAMNKTNKLIDKVAEVINLELEKEDTMDYAVEDLEPLAITFDGKQTINLKADPGDTEAHFVVIDGITVSFNKKADDYEKIKESVTAADVYITDFVKEALAEQTITTLDENTVKESALEKIREFYGSNCIVRISLQGYMFQ